MSPFKASAPSEVITGFSQLRQDSNGLNAHGIIWSYHRPISQKWLGYLRAGMAYERLSYGVY